jgi:gliding motility-associated protein GldL
MSKKQLKEREAQSVSEKKSILKRFQALLASKRYKKFMAQLYGWGAAVVILGALFKINHFPGANIMLILGMGTEAVIFTFSSFEPLHPDYHWEHIYPELVEVGEVDIDAHEAPAARNHSGVQVNELVVQKLEELFLQANITPEIFNRLEAGLERLVETTGNVSNVTNILVANDNYVTKVNEMTSKMGETTQSIAGLKDLYMKQMEVVDTQAKVTASLQSSMNEVLETLGASLADAKKYKNDIADLSSKVAKLNDVYGKMMSAILSAAQN